nr:hypothetical protein Iba_chr12dCG3380 [Ipomoea batatas]
MHQEEGITGASRADYNHSFRLDWLHSSSSLSRRLCRHLHLQQQIHQHSQHQYISAANQEIKAGDKFFRTSDLQQQSMMMGKIFSPINPVNAKVKPVFLDEPKAPPRSAAAADVTALGKRGELAALLIELHGTREEEVGPERGLHAPTEVVPLLQRAAADVVAVAGIAPHHQRQRGVVGEAVDNVNAIDIAEVGIWLRG